MYVRTILWTEYFHTMLRKLTLRKAAYLFFLLEKKKASPPTSLLAVEFGA